MRLRLAARKRGVLGVRLAAAVLLTVLGGGRLLLSPAYAQQAVSPCVRSDTTGSCTPVTPTYPLPVTNVGGGGGGPATIANGADVVEGTINDTHTQGTVVGFLKDIWTALTTGPVPVSGSLTAVTTVGTITNPVTVAQPTAANLNATVVNAAGSAIIGKVGIDQTTPNVTNGVNLLASTRATYRAEILAYGAYATPTDMVCINGSATKTVYVTALAMTLQSTAGALQTLYFIKRSTADTGGTPTVATPTALDSTDGAATASITTYATAPSPLGTAVGNLTVVVTSSATLTGTPGLATLASYIPTNSFTIAAQPVVLHGVAEGLCVNYNGAALTSGFSSNINAEWVEQ